MAPISPIVQKSDEPPLHSRTSDGPGLWGVRVALLADGTLYVSLLFGWIYLWTVAPSGFLPTQAAISPYAMGVGGLLLSIAAFFNAQTTQHLETKSERQLSSQLWLSLGFALAYIGVFCWLLLQLELAVTQTAHDALLFVMLMFVLFHSVLVLGALLLQVVRVKIGLVSRELPYELYVLKPLLQFTVIIYWASVVSFLILPELWHTTG